MINLFESLIYLGANPETIYLIEKYYSTNAEVVEKLIEFGIQKQSNSLLSKLGEFAKTFKSDIAKMWSHVLSSLERKKHIKGVIILDDGGRCLAAAPDKILAHYYMQQR